jgi:hypothetical protein
MSTPSKMAFWLFPSPGPRRLILLPVMRSIMPLEVAGSTGSAPRLSRAIAKHSSWL